MLPHSSFAIGMVHLLVFDLDGTLVDSQKDLADAANALIADLGGTPQTDAAIASMVGEGAALLVRRALAAADLSPDTPGALEAFLRHYDERLLRHTRPYDGMLTVVRTLHATRRIAVLTNKPTHATLRILEELAFAPLLTGVIGGDTVFGRKPDPAGLHYLIAAAGASPASTLLVGDSPVDLETARRAGTPVCLARYGFGYRFAGSEFTGDEFFIDAPAELLKVVESLDGRTPD